MLRAPLTRPLPPPRPCCRCRPPQLVIKTCHRRGAFAMGGMSAVIPIKGDEAANQVRVLVRMGMCMRV